MSETGYEDISYKNAEEALKSALKNYVGTEKTFTRPLDLVVIKLKELEQTRNKILKGIDNKIKIELDQVNLNLTKNKLLSRKLVIENLRQKILLNLNSNQNPNSSLDLDFEIIGTNFDKSKIIFLENKIKELNYENKKRLFAIIIISFLLILTTIMAIIRNPIYYGSVFITAISIIILFFYKFKNKKQISELISRKNKEILDINAFHKKNIFKEYDIIINELNDINIKIKENEIILENILEVEQELTKIDEKIYQYEIKKNKLEEINEALKIAQNVLKEANDELKTDFIPILNKKMSSVLNVITNKKYVDLRADDSLLLKTIDSKTGNIISVLELSGGTIDQIFLALRIAVSDINSINNEKLPIIADEIFAQYDDERTKQTLKYFFDISNDRQIILFTKSTAN